MVSRAPCRFVNELGKPSTRAARAYVYAALAGALEDDLRVRDGWIRGGLAHKDDHLALREAKKILDGLKRKAGHDE